MFVDPAVWLPLLLPTVSGSVDTETETRCAHIAILGGLCRGASRSWLLGHADVVSKALQGPGVLPHSSSPSVNTLLAQTASHLAMSCAPLPADLRASIVNTIVGLQFRAWSAGARDIPAEEHKEEPLRGWVGVQGACAEALESACAKGERVGELLAREGDAVLDALATECAEDGGVLPLLEVLLRQADASLLSASTVQRCLTLIISVVEAGGQAAGEALALCSFLLGSGGVAVVSSPTICGLLESALGCVRSSSLATIPEAERELGFVLAEREEAGGCTADNALAALECAYLIFTECSGRDWGPALHAVGPAVRHAVRLTSAHARQLAIKCAQHACDDSSCGDALKGELLAYVVPRLADPQDEVRLAALAALSKIFAGSKSSFPVALLESAKELVGSMIFDGEGGDEAGEVVTLIHSALKHAVGCLEDGSGLS